MKTSRPRLSITLPVLAILAVIAVGTWLAWCWGAFNHSSWNDVRLAPTFNLTLPTGGAIYGGPEGAPNTWMYGPLPVWSLLPATWAAGPATALGLAGALNLVYMLVAIGLVCAFTPIRTLSVSRAHRALAFLVTVALWPRATWQFIQADNLAIAVGLLGNLVLMRSRSQRATWLAAALATAGLFCKQTAVAVPIAQLLWLGLAQDWRSAGAHLLRLMVTGLAWLALLFALEDPAAVWFTLVTIPGGLPWASDLGARFASTAPALIFQLGVPLATWLWLRRQSTRADLALPFLTCALAVPPGLAAMLTYGGNINSMHGFALWAPASAVVLIAKLAQHRGPAQATVIATALVIGSCTLNVAVRDQREFGLNQQRYDDALALAQARPGQAWFPWHPLVTIYSEGRRYADGDGIAVRALSGHGVNRAQLAHHLPPDFNLIAVPVGTPTWGIAEELSPPDVRRFLLGEWLLNDWSYVSNE